MRLKIEFSLFLGPLEQVASGSVGLKSYENPNLLNVLQGRVNPIEAADEEVTDKAVEEARVFVEQRGKTIAQRLARLVRNERQVRRRRPHV